MKKNQLVKEVVTFSIKCRLEYETKEGRRLLISYAREDLHFSLLGAGVKEREYSIESIPNSVRIVKSEGRKKIE